MVLFNKALIRALFYGQAVWKTFGGKGWSTFTVAGLFAWAVMLVSAEAHGQQNNCLGVLSYSKLTAQDAKDVASYSETQWEYCDEQRTAKIEGSTASFKAKWKILGAGMSRSNSSSEENYRKFCNEDGSIKRNRETINSVVETLPSEAYEAYESCINMQENRVTFDLGAMSRKEAEFSIPVAFRAQNRRDSAQLSFTLTRGSPDSAVECNWEFSNEDGGFELNRENLTFTTTGTAFLKCKRESFSESTDITVVRGDAGGDNAILFQWGTYEQDSNGNWHEVDVINDLQQQIETLRSEQSELITRNQHLADKQELTETKLKALFSSDRTQRFTWKHDEQPVQMIRAREGICFLTLVEGSFQDMRLPASGGRPENGDVAAVYVDGDHWHLGGSTASYGTGAEAMCWRFPQMD